MLEMDRINRRKLGGAGYDRVSRIQISVWNKDQAPRNEISSLLLGAESGCTVCT